MSVNGLAAVDEVSQWYQGARQSDCCWNDLHGYKCPTCEPDGFCEMCDTFEGRGIEQIFEYASTCDGCAKLVHHDLQRISPSSDDQLSYCENCRPELFIGNVDG